MWTRVMQSSERLPTGVRVASILVLPFVAFATNASLGTAATGPLFALFVALTGFALWTHLPVLVFAGPLPFSDQGVHRSGRVFGWEQVTTIEAGEGRDLVAVITNGERVPLRVRGDRTHEQLRDVVARHKPEAIQF